MRLLRVAFCAALYLFAQSISTLAQDVTLTSRDGRVEISGTLLGYDGEFFRVETLYGELTVDGSGVNCDGPGCPNLDSFVAELAISGSETIGAVLMPALVEGFAARNGYDARRTDTDETHFIYELMDVRTEKRAGIFTFRLTNSDEGFADLLADEADLVMSLREISPEEQRRAKDAGMGDLTKAGRSRVLALDAIVPIVSPQNPVQEISPLDLARAYGGQITNWTELGGPDAPIVLHAPAQSSGLTQAAVVQLLGPAQLEFTDGITHHLRGSALATAVDKDPFALGLSSFAEVGTAQALTLQGACGRMLRASRRSIKTEDYPLTAPMFLYTPVRRLPKLAREFMAFARGQEAQIVIRRSGFVDQTPEEVPITEQGDRFANAIAAAGPEIDLSELQRMITLLGAMQRLTTSFRFETGSTRLDAQSRSNIVQLAQDLERGWFDGRRMFFVGFSDGQGAADRNRQIALSRAKAVRSAILTAAETADVGQVDLQIDAFGEAMPLACDDSEWGRQANRRVEVWLR